LEARQIDASRGKLSAEAMGEIELDGNVLVIRRISVHYRLRAPKELRDTIERIHAIHADHCPVARSIRAAIEISTSYELLPPDQDLQRVNGVGRSANYGRAPKFSLDARRVHVSSAATAQRAAAEASGREAEESGWDAASWSRRQSGPGWR
jgi:hypothetical protein